MTTYQELKNIANVLVCNYKAKHGLIGPEEVCLLIKKAEEFIPESCDAFRSELLEALCEEHPICKDEPVNLNICKDKPIGLDEADFIKAYFQSNGWRCVYKEGGVRWRGIGPNMKLGHSFNIPQGLVSMAERAYEKLNS